MLHGQAPGRFIFPWTQGYQVTPPTEGGRVTVPCFHRTMPPQYPVQIIRLVGGLVSGIMGTGLRGLVVQGPGLG